jgi:hypothetical protein
MMLLTYNEALKMASEYLSKIDNIQKFCHEHDLDYANVLRIKNNKSKTKFPNIISKILIIFGNDVTIHKICFDINTYKDGTDSNN